MPYTASPAELALNARAKPVKGRVAVLGVPTSPASATSASPRAEDHLLLRELGAEVDYHDPHVPALSSSSSRAPLKGARLGPRVVSSSPPIPGSTTKIARRARRYSTCAA